MQIDIPEATVWSGIAALIGFALMVWRRLDNMQGAINRHNEKIEEHAGSIADFGRKHSESLEVLTRLDEKVGYLIKWIEGQGGPIRPVK